MCQPEGTALCRYQTQQAHQSSAVEVNARISAICDRTEAAGATASVGLAMGAAGTDVALETADIALMGDDLSHLPFAVRLARKTLSIINQNIWFSIAFKGVFLILAFFGLAKLCMIQVSSTIFKFPTFPRNFGIKG